MQTHVPTHTASPLLRLFSYGTRKESGQDWWLAQLLVFIAMVYKLVYLLIFLSPLGRAGPVSRPEGTKTFSQVTECAGDLLPPRLFFHTALLFRCFLVCCMLPVSTQTAMPGLAAPSHCLPAFSSEINKRLVPIVNYKSTHTKKIQTPDRCAVQYLKGLSADFPCKQSDSTTIDYKNWVCFKELIMAMKNSLTWCVLFCFPPQWLHIVNSWEKQTFWIKKSIPRIPS